MYTLEKQEHHCTEVMRYCFVIHNNTYTSFKQMVIRLRMQEAQLL